MKSKNARALSFFGLAIGLGGPILVRLASDRGYVANYHTLLFGTILLGLACVVGGVLSYRAAREQVDRNLRGDFD